MPAFHTLVSTGKRKIDSDFEPINRKKQTPDTRESGGGSETFWVVQWRVPQARKHKTWDADGVLVVSKFKGTLYSIEEKILATGTVREPISESVQLTLGGKELEVDRAISRAEYLSGACFGRAPAASITSVSTATKSSSNYASKKFAPPLKSISLNPASDAVFPSQRFQHKSLESMKLAAPSSQDATKGNARESESYWTVNWRRPQQKKNKTWDGDAYLMCKGKKLTLVSESGRILGTKAFTDPVVHKEYLTRIGNREVQLDMEISASQMPTVTGVTLDEPSVDTEYGPEPNYSPVQDIKSSCSPKSSIKSSDSHPSPMNSVDATRKFVPPALFYAKKEKPKGGPMHDPNAEGALVMKAPTENDQTKFNKKRLPLVPVVVDPVLGRYLRPHQKEGVKFLYECVMGLRKHEGQGCILADEMGLGKTLQTITLVWTLLKQNPYAGAGSVIGKALIVCPVSLVNNWKMEFHKWLGRDRVGVFVGDKDKTVIKQFINSRIHQVLVIGYEKLRTVIADLAYCNPPIGLIICDEGHRLKSANNKTSKMFEALRTPRRIILSGTPIQNDLGEFHAMADFCNPGLLDDYNTFRRVYEQPILKSRAPGCTTKEAEIGEARSAQLLAVARSFVLRRDASILGNYLPPKFQYVVFVTPTALQLSIFAKILNKDKLDDIIRSSTADSLALINTLTKVSNSPILLKATVDKAKAAVPEQGGHGLRKDALLEAAKLLPPNARVEDVSLSGKLIALADLLQALRMNTEEKCVIVSHYTSTLNIIEAFCRSERYTYYRLDGQTQQAKRQEYVNDFNRSSQSSRFLFLLSSKAGGVGLNLIGASRLCLIDSDWNPSHDLQSMARIHRDGQKRPVFIYRFLTTGAIDEKIYQRQITKLGLSDSLMNNGKAGSKSDSFSRKDLRDIFNVHPYTNCQTHDLLECPCDITEDGPRDDLLQDALEGIDDDDDDESDDDSDRKGFMNASQVKLEEINRVDKAYMKKKKAALAALSEWTHINCLKLSARDNVQDDILRKMLYVPDTYEDVPQGEDKSQIRTIQEGNVDDALTMKENTSGFDRRSMPGGTISFLFEKGSRATLNETEDDRGAS